MTPPTTLSEEQKELLKKIQQQFNKAFPNGVYVEQSGCYDDECCGGPNYEIASSTVKRFARKAVEDAVRAERENFAQILEKEGYTREQAQQILEPPKD